MGNMFNLFGAGGGKTEGLYIWKKFKWNTINIVNPQFHAYASSNSYITLSNANFDLALLNSVSAIENVLRITDGEDAKKLIEFLDGFRASDDKFWEYWSSGLTVRLRGYTYTPYPSNWDNVTNKLKIVDNMYNSITIDDTFTYTGTKTLHSVGDFLGYVVSDDETKYPDKAEQDGFYYEKIELSPALFGCTKMEVGTFTPASNVRTYIANHNLGVIPKYAIVWAESSASYNIRNVQAYNINTGSSGYISVYKSDYYARGDYSGSGTASVSRVGIYASSYSTSYYFQSGKKYTYVLLG